MINLEMICDNDISYKKENACQSNISHLLNAQKTKLYNSKRMILCRKKFIRIISISLLQEI